MIGCWERIQAQMKVTVQSGANERAKPLQDRHAVLCKEPAEVGDVSPFSITKVSNRTACKLLLIRQLSCCRPDRHL